MRGAGKDHNRTDGETLRDGGFLSFDMALALRRRSVDEHGGGRIPSQRKNVFQARKRFDVVRLRLNWHQNKIGGLRRRY